MGVTSVYKERKENAAIWKLLVMSFLSRRRMRSGPEGVLGNPVLVDAVHIEDEEADLLSMSRVRIAGQSGRGWRSFFGLCILPQVAAVGDAQVFYSGETAS
jgi:hypothetical protein